MCFSHTAHSSALKNGQKTDVKLSLFQYQKKKKGNFKDTVNYRISLV